MHQSHKPWLSMHSDPYRGGMASYNNRIPHTFLNQFLFYQIMLTYNDFYWHRIGGFYLHIYSGATFLIPFQAIWYILVVYTYKIPWKMGDAVPYVMMNPMRSSKLHLPYAKILQLSYPIYYVHSFETRLWVEDQQRRLWICPKASQWRPHIRFSVSLVFFFLIERCGMRSYRLVPPRKLPADT